MSTLLNELRIFHRKAIYPGRFGGNLRSIGLARLASESGIRTTLFSMDNDQDFEGIVEGVPVIQEKEFRSSRKRIGYYLLAPFVRELIIPYTERAFISPEQSLFQIEDPLFFPLLKKKGISRFILDEHNAYWEMYSFSHPDLKQRIYAKIAAGRDKENERQALLQATHILCTSLRDRDLLIGEVPDIGDRISVIPNCVNIHEYDHFTADKERSVTEKSRILFVGLMAYAPNVEAARLICDEIAPLCPECEFIIAGKNPPRIDCPQNVMFPGYVDDIRPVIAGSDICIAPIRSGSGTRIKVLEYMAMGKPVISTSKGAEGIDYTDSLNIIIENRIEKYPEIIRQLLDDEKKCSALGREAQKLIDTKYDWQLYRKPLEKIYREAMAESR
jgi:glycosyltransferase involved in cell wall biosynthesis